MGDNGIDNFDYKLFSSESRRDLLNKYYTNKESYYEEIYNIYMEKEVNKNFVRESFYFSEKIDV